MKLRKNQKILVTGLNGFVGKHLVRELSGAGHEVYGVSRESSASEEIDSLLARYWQAELTDLQEVQRIDWQKIDSVIHLAGLASVGASFDNPGLYMRVNAGIIRNLFEAAKIAGKYPRIISISSGAVYGRTVGPVSEGSPTAPSNPYAMSKLASEEIVGEYRTQGFDDSVNVRPFNHAGPGQAGGFLIPDLGKQIIENDGSIQVGNLSSSRDYTDVRDVTRAYRLLAETPMLSHDVYNVCSGLSVKGEEILEMLKAAAGKPKIVVKVEETKLRANDDDVIVGSYSRLRKDTGWEPKIPLSKTIQDYIDFEKSKS